MSTCARLCQHPSAETLVAHYITEALSNSQGLMVLGFFSAPADAVRETTQDAAFQYLEGFLVGTQAQLQALLATYNTGASYLNHGHNLSHAKAHRIKDIEM